MTEDWRTDELTLDPNLDSVHFAVHMMSAIEHGDIPLIKYLLEQGVPVSSTLGKWPAGDSPDGNPVLLWVGCESNYV